MKNITKAAQALSDDTRLRILNLIMQRECCVCEVMQALNISQTRASRNLKILHDAGFLDMRNDGLFTLYSLKRRGNQDVYAHLLNADPYVKSWLVTIKLTKPEELDELLTPQEYSDLNSIVTGQVL